MRHDETVPIIKINIHLCLQLRADCNESVRKGGLGSAETGSK